MGKGSNEYILIEKRLYKDEHSVQSLVRNATPTLQKAQ